MAQVAIGNPEHDRFVEPERLVTQIEHAKERAAQRDHCDYDARVAFQPF
jgi:hypothetical protein